MDDSVSEHELQETKDDNGEIIERWFLWHTGEGFNKSGPIDRIYLRNLKDGQYLFGDGIRGKIPPTGVDNIRITYFIGGGTQGNVKAKEIKVLKNFIPFVDSVINPLPAEGGMDSETTDRLLMRGSRLLRNRNRAITVTDYESLIYDSFPSIAKVKCLGGIDLSGKSDPAHIMIAIIPSSLEDKPLPSLALINDVKRYLATRSSKLISNFTIEVVPPVYVATSITGDIYPSNAIFSRGSPK